MNRSKGTIAPIYFNIPEQRNLLLKTGFVYVCRHKKRINTGTTVARKGNFKKFVDLATVDVKYEGHVEKQQELKPYLKESGFETTREWICTIKDGLPGHLYRVKVVSKIESNTKNTKDLKTKKAKKGI
jgi:hypothetical protein